MLQVKETWDANLALFQEYKECYRYNFRTKCLDEIAKRYGWESYRSLQRTAKRFGIAFETLRYAARKQG